MASVKATKAGSWSDPTVWDTGVLPTAADDVYANNFAVVVNQSFTVLSIRTEAATGINAGGSFTVNASGLTLNCDVRSGTSVCLVINFATGTINVNGNAYGGISSNIFGINLTGTNSVLNYVGNATGGSATNTHGVNIASTGTVNMTGNATAGSSTGQGVMVALAGTLNMTGNAFGGSLASGHGVGNTTTGTVNITGNVTGGSNATAYGVNNAGLGTVIVSGSAIGGSAGPGANNASTGTMRVTTAQSHSTNNVPGLNGAVAGGITVVTNGIMGSQGQCPHGNFVKYANGNLSTFLVYREDGSSVTLIDMANVAAQLPAIGDVRFGVPYNLGNRVGTLRVPNPANVRKDVQTDNTVGSADLTAADIWNTLLATLTTPNSIGARLKDVSTVQSTGDQLAATL